MKNATIKWRFRCLFQTHAPRRGSNGADAPQTYINLMLWLTLGQLATITSLSGQKSPIYAIL
jgi:hypothetical protein